MRLVKVGARIIYQARYWHVHIASAFALRHHYRAVLGWEALSEHNLRDSLQGAGRIGMSKIHRRREF